MSWSSSRSIAAVSLVLAFALVAGPSSAQPPPQSEGTGGAAGYSPPIEMPDAAEPMNAPSRSLEAPADAAPQPEPAAPPSDEGTPDDQGGKPQDEGSEGADQPVK
jgi:hypothetical protein